MRITIREAGVRGTELELVLRVERNGDQSACQFNTDHRAVWFADPASEASTNPAASPLGASQVCGLCLNNSIENGVEVTEIDADSF